MTSSRPLKLAWLPSLRFLVKSAGQLAKKSPQIFVPYIISFCLWFRCTVLILWKKIIEGAIQDEHNRLEKAKLRPLDYVQRVICIIYVSYQIPISLAANKRLQKIGSQTSKMATWKMFWITLVFVAIHFHAITWAANVALFKPITASATCGLSEVEEYYSVTERNKFPRQRILSYCEASNASLSHNASDIVDGDLATWWQAPNSVENVSITIDLRGEHQKVS